MDDEIRSIVKGLKDQIDNLSKQLRPAVSTVSTSAPKTNDWDKVTDELVKHYPPQGEKLSEEIGRVDIAKIAGTVLNRTVSFDEIDAEYERREEEFNSRPDRRITPSDKRRSERPTPNLAPRFGGKDGRDFVVTRFNRDYRVCGSLSSGFQIGKNLAKK